MIRILQDARYSQKKACPGIVGPEQLNLLYDEVDQLVIVPTYPVL